MTVDAVGGVWRYAMELASALRRFGISVTFAGLGPQPTSAQIREAERIGDLLWIDEPLDWMAANERELDTLPRTIARLAEIHDVDLVHLNLPSQACDLDLPVPVLVASHSCVLTWWQVMRREPLPEAWAWLKRRNAAGLKRAQAVLVPSHSHARLVEQCYGLVPALKVIPNAIASFPRSTTKENFVFAAARWWDEGKNARVLDAAARDTSWPVAMAGALTGPSGQRFDIKFAQALGGISHGHVLDYMRRAAVFVSPSLYEPFGLAALEAARSGAVLLLSDIPTYRELWDGAAFFFDPANPDALCDAIERLINDPELRLEFGERAHTRSLGYVPTEQAQAVSDLYRSLAHAGALTGGTPVEA